MSLLVLPRNFHPRRWRRLSNADVLLVSIPKSGRTWLRFMLRHYLCDTAGIPFSIDGSETEPSAVPRLACSHDLWEHTTAPRLADRLTGKYMIPFSARRSKKVILAIRDLRDVMVSMHLHLTRRGFRSGARFSGSVSDVARDPRFGAVRTVEILNHWLDEWREPGHMHVFSYEACLKDPHSSMRDVFHFLGIGDIDEERLEEAIDFSSFDSMREMERDNRFDRQLLRPGDPNDPESFKVRRGKAGGYVDYLSTEDADFILEAAAKIRL